MTLATTPPDLRTLRDVDVCVIGLARLGYLG
jgi:hypothetical protein